MSTKKPSLFDFSDGNYVFGFTGLAIAKAVESKREHTEIVIQDLLEQIKREVGEDITLMPGLIVAVLGDQPSERTLYIRSLGDRVNQLMDEVKDLDRISRGILRSTEAIYKLTVRDMKKFGL